MSPGDWPKREDDCHQGRTSRNGILEQCQTGVMRGQALSLDARTNHCDKQKSRSNELSQQSDAQRWSPWLWN
jgi:hypothetical protein